MLFVFFSISLLLCAVPIKANEDWAALPSRIIEFVFRPITFVFKTAGRLLSYVFHKDQSNNEIRENSQLSQLSLKNKPELDLILSSLLKGIDGTRNLITDTGFEDLQNTLNLLLNNVPIEGYNFLPEILSSNRQLAPIFVSRPIAHVAAPRPVAHVAAPRPVAHVAAPRPVAHVTATRPAAPVRLRPAPIPMHRPAVPQTILRPQAPVAPAVAKPQAVPAYKPQPKAIVKPAEPQKYPSAG